MGSENRVLRICGPKSEIIGDCEKINNDELDNMYTWMDGHSMYRAWGRTGTHRVFVEKLARDHYETETQVEELY
jgi:hypothetical protein